MEHLYGTLNKSIEKITYTGKETDTAEVVVDNRDRTIAVNVKEVGAITTWESWEI